MRSAGIFGGVCSLVLSFPLIWVPGLRHRLSCFCGKHVTPHSPVCTYSMTLLAPLGNPPGLPPLRTATSCMTHWLCTFINPQDKACFFSSLRCQLNFLNSFLAWLWELNLGLHTCWESALLVDPPLPFYVETRSYQVALTGLELTL